MDIAAFEQQLESKYPIRLDLSYRSLDDEHDGAITLSRIFVEDALKVPFKEYTNMLNEMDITVNYSDHSNFWAVLLTER